MPPFSRASTAISPTAHYTGHVWSRNGLSHPELSTLEGRLMFESIRPLMTVSGLVGGPTLEKYLLARHRALDELLRRAIEDDGVTQVIEVACGMSARGWRFTQRYGEALSYVEADLPAMAARKRAALSRMGSLGERHRVLDADALIASGPSSLAAISGELDPAAGLVIVCEGLLTYLPGDVVVGLWERIAMILSGFSVGLHLTDLRGGGGTQAPLVRGLMLGLRAFVRGRVHLHFEDEREAVSALLGAGFTSAEVLQADTLGLPSGDSRRGSGGQLTRVVRACVGPANSSRGRSHAQTVGPLPDTFEPIALN